MGQKQSTNGALGKLLQKAINEGGWQPEFMRELEDVQPPPVEHIIGEKAPEPVSTAAEDEPEPVGVSSESIAGLGAPEGTEAIQVPPCRESARKSVFRSRVFLRVAAMLLICVLLGGGAMLLSDRGRAQADKQELEELLPTGEEGLSVVSSQEMRTEAFAVDFIVESEEKISEAKKFWPDLCIPQYIPKGYDFESLHIKKKKESFAAEYLYKNKEDALFIIIQTEKRVNTDSVFIEDIVEGESSEDGASYYLEDKELGINSYYSYQITGIELVAVGKMKKDLLKKVVENMVN